jgi:hypothetical protein
METNKVEVKRLQQLLKGGYMGCPSAFEFSGFAAYASKSFCKHPTFSLASSTA